MDNENIDNIGVSVIETYIARTSLLVPELRRADKKPLFDGVLRLYKSKKHQNSTYLGDVNVQIKTHDKISTQDEIETYIERSELETYKRNGGVLYFVVFIGDENKSKAYFADLYPVLIKKYLEQTPKNKKIKVHMRELPSDRSLFEKEVFKFYNDSIYQASSFDRPIVKINDFLQKQGEKHFTIYTPIIGNKSEPFYYLSTDFNTIYATDADNNILFPIGDGRYKLVFIGKNKNPISINGQVYYDYTIVREHNGHPCMVIDNFLFCSFFPEIVKCQLSYHSYNTKARARLKELNFILDLNKYKSFSIGEVEIPCEEFILKDDLVAALESERNTYSRIIKLLDALHIADDFDYNNLTQNEKVAFNNLYEGIILNKHITLEYGETGLKIISIGNFKIYVVFAFVRDHVFHIEDFFTSAHIQCFMDSEHNKYSSRYDVLSVQDMLDASNFYFDGVVDSYKTLLISNPDIVQVAYRDLQRYILSYDLSDGKKNDFLRIANDLVNWLIEINAFDSNDIKLDLYQIKKRLQTMTEEDVKDIYLIEDSTHNLFSKIACNILTGNKIKASMLISQLSEEDRVLLQSAPISHLMKNNN